MLGVYFGLTLAGTPPWLFGQPTGTPSIGRKDQQRTPVSDSVLGYLQDVEYLFATLARTRRQQDYEAAREAFDVAQSTLVPCVERNTAGRFTPLRFSYAYELTRPAIERFSRSMVYGYSLGDCVGNNEFGGLEAVATRFSYKLDRSEFSVKISITKGSPQRALELARELRATLSPYARDANQVVRQTAARTSVRAENDQVFIVTRLPRSGLDALLSQLAK